MRYDTRNDEYYTPPYAIDPILEFIPRDSIIWCPFDTKHSLYVQKLRQHGCKVIATHIREGRDFFTYQPSQHYDYIISNPPFSLKTQVLERLFALDKPFAMLLSLRGYSRAGDTGFSGIMILN